MYVHLGADIVVDIPSIVAILDTKRIQRSADGRALLERAAKEGTRSLPARTVVVTTRGVYLSSAAAETVARRVRQMTRSGRGATAKS